MRFATAAFLLSALLSSTTLARQQDQTLTGDLDGTYTAPGTITARDATVRAGTGATFRAGQRVRLEAGVRIEAGATFRAEVDPDVGSGGGGGGPIVLSQMPNALPNVRFYADQFSVVRPALTLHEFDSPDYTGDDHGYGLKQVLERVYGIEDDPDELVRSVYREIILTANEDLEDPLSPPSGRSARGVINVSSAITQSRAFVALATYVLEQNGYTTGDYQITPGPPDQTRA